MPIPITCAACGTRLKAPDTVAGRKIKCPKCGGVVAVPAAPAAAAPAQKAAPRVQKEAVTAKSKQPTAARAAAPRPKQEEALTRTPAKPKGKSDGYDELEIVRPGGLDAERQCAQQDDQPRTGQILHQNEVPIWNWNFWILSPGFLRIGWAIATRSGPIGDSQDTPMPAEARSSEACTFSFSPNTLPTSTKP